MGEGPPENCRPIEFCVWKAGCSTLSLIIGCYQVENHVCMQVNFVIFSLDGPFNSIVTWLVLRYSTKSELVKLLSYAFMYSVRALV